MSRAPETTEQAGTPERPWIRAEADRPDHRSDPDSVAPYGGPPTEPIRVVPAAPAYEPATLVQPASAVYQQSYVVPDPVVSRPVVAEPMIEPLYARPPEKNWSFVVAMAAIAALLIGGVAGFLIGNAIADDERQLTDTSTPPIDQTSLDQAAVDQAVNDVFDTLLAQARQDGQVNTPTPYPQLDALLALSQGTADSASAAATDQQAEVDALTAERDDLTAQVALLLEQSTVLQQQLTDAEAERDELRATLEDSGGVTSEMQAQADAQAQEITRLQGELNTAKSNADQARAEVQRLQAELDEANAALEDLNVQPLGNVVGVDIATVRNTARTNGWVVVERQVDNATAVPNSVTLQIPAPESNMIAGSVLYVETAKKPGP